MVSVEHKNVLGYLSGDIISSSKLTIFLELRPRETICSSEQIMSADKYPSEFSRQMHMEWTELKNDCACVTCAPVGGKISTQATNS